MTFWIFISIFQIHEIIHGNHSLNLCQEIKITYINTKEEINNQSNVNSIDTTNKSRYSAQKQYSMQFRCNTKYRTVPHDRLSHYTQGATYEYTSERLVLLPL